MQKCRLPLILLCLLFIGCAAHTNLEPVGANRVNINSSVGGPIIEIFDTNMPIPYLTTGINYGVSDRVNLDANLHLLPLAYEIFGLDVGTTFFPILNDGLIPTVGIQSRYLILSSFKENVKVRIRAYPVVSGSAAWAAGEGLLYSGMDVTLPQTSLDYYKYGPQLILSPFAGYRWEIGQDFRLFTELKLHAANHLSDLMAVNYTSVGGWGATTVLISLERTFR